MTAETGVPMSAIQAVAIDDELAALLRACELPTADLERSPLRMLGLREHGRLRACVGLQCYPPDALLRSLAVQAELRGRGVGGLLLAAAEAHCQAAGVRTLYLLTSSADGYFAAHGYQPVARELAPPAIRTTQQFASLCPSQAVLMKKPLPI